MPRGMIEVLRRKPSLRRMGSLIATLLIPIIFIAEPLHALGRSPLVPAPSLPEGRSVGPASSQWSVGFHDVELFGIAGLRSFGARGSLRMKPFIVGAQATRIVSGVGSEMALSTTFGWMGPSIGWAAVVLEHQNAAIGPWTSTLTTVGITAGTRISDDATLSVRVERFRVAGVDHPGVDVSLGVDVAAARMVSVSASIRVDRRYGSDFKAAIHLRPLHIVGFSAGLDQADETIFCRMTVNAAGIAATVGVWLHEVLGMSRGVSLLWQG